MELGVGGRERTCITFSKNSQILRELGGMSSFCSPHFTENKVNAYWKRIR